MFGWLRRKKKPKSLKVKISATEISDAKRRDMDTALEWLNHLLDNEGFEVDGRSRNDFAGVTKHVEVDDHYSYECEIYLDIIVDQRESGKYEEYVSKVEMSVNLAFADIDEEIIIENNDDEMTYKKCRSTYEKFMQKVEKTVLLLPEPGPE